MQQSSSLTVVFEKYGSANSIRQGPSLERIDRISYEYMYVLRCSGKVTFLPDLICLMGDASGCDCGPGAGDVSLVTSFPEILVGSCR